MSTTARAFVLLNSWFQQYRRSFPWRQEVTPYRVWISEVMLQQTQAIRVASFFARWMKRFPTVLSLSKGTEEEVLKLWEGLGYYSRAKALVQGARYLETHFQGNIPKERALLEQIPGIGPYTQGAIRSFAFHERAPAVDANVERVMARFLDLPLQKGSAAGRKQIEQFLEEHLPKKTPWFTMEALIELGALVCTTDPDCTKCPVRTECLSLQHDTIQERPIGAKRVPRIREKRLVFLFEKGDRICVVKRTGKTVMSGLFEFPYVPFPEKIETVLGAWQSSITPLSSVTHSYTKYTVTLVPYVIPVSEDFCWSEGVWLPKIELGSLPFSSGHKRVLTSLLDLNSFLL